MIGKTLIVLTLVFLTYSQNYNQDLGISLCQLAVASYCAPARVQAWTCKPCYDSNIKMEHVQTFKNSSGEVVGFIGTSVDPSAIYLVFRGTLPWDIYNWLESIDFVKVNYPLCNNGCQVHRGFYREYLDVAKQVISTVKDYQAMFQKSKVIVAGHSLGGVLATHAAIQLVSEGVNVQELYTFGSPRAGDVRFSTWFDSFIRTNNRDRVTHARDPVPHSPSPILGFHHIDHEIYYKGAVRDGWVSCNDSGSRQDPNCSNRNIADIVLTDHLTYYDIDFSGTIFGCQS